MAKDLGLKIPHVVSGDTVCYVVTSLLVLVNDVMACSRCAACCHLIECHKVAPSSKVNRQRRTSLFVLAVISPLFNDTVNWIQGV